MPHHLLIGLPGNGYLIHPFRNLQIDLGDVMFEMGHIHVFHIRLDV